VTQLVATGNFSAVVVDQEKLKNWTKNLTLNVETIDPAL
jgi:hypothetical protein